MLKFPFPTQHAQVFHKKTVQIIITNKCKYKCGGCTQHCDIFRNRKDELWDIPLDQLEMNLETVIHPIRQWKRRHVLLFGGEPTVHPKFQQILELAASYDGRLTFGIPTACGTGKLPSNCYEYFNPKSAERSFVASLMAPVDIMPLKNKKFYWNLAQKNCWVYNNERCGTGIYDNKAFICCPGAATQRLQYGKENWSNSVGWDVELGKDCFAQTEQAINQQAEAMCWRCPVALGKRPYQSIAEPSIVSITNLDLMRSTDKFKPVIPTGGVEPPDTIS